MGDDATGLTQRELLMEMREDIKGLKTTVDAIARDQAAGVERRAAMQQSADGLYARLDGHDRDLDPGIAIDRARERGPGGRAGRRENGPAGFQWRARTQEVR